jgi:hypothetical protein
MVIFALAVALAAGHGHVLRSGPFVGVACRTPNTIACDRVGMFVRIVGAAAGVRATIDGRPLVLHSHGLGGGPDSWVGYLHPAGLLDGPLAPHGTAFPSARVVVSVRRPNGVVDRVRRRVPVHAGWG